MSEETKQKWYQSPLGIIALLILFFPAGLFFLWRYPKWDKTVKGVLTFIVIVFLIGASNSNKSADTKATPTNTQPTKGVAAAKPTVSPTKPAPTKSSKHELDATVKFNEQAFLITNNEKSDWTTCKLELNSGLFSGGYVYKQTTIPANDAVIIPFREFTKGDGTRFNADTTKPQNVSIACDVDGTHGFNYFGIK